MLPQSIRWRLPLTYAAIALITALVLGAVLLTILSGYYHRQEKSYLKTNAKDLETYIAELYQPDMPPEMIRNQLDPTALFIQVRIRLLGPDRVEVYDSGRPDKIKTLQVALDETAADDEAVTIEGGQLVSVSTDLVDSLFIYIIDMPSPNESVLHFAGYTVDLEQADLTEGGRIVFGNLREPVEYAVPYPLDINTSGVSPDEIGHFFHRSDQTLEIPIYDSDHTLVGYLELRDGPAFGYQIINQVGRGWAVSSVVAVIFAALVGWLISRRMSGPLISLNRITEQMARGDLAVRADTAPSGEIGQLARSFNSMAAQVEKTISALRQFVADAAHELHTPLTSLRINLDLIIDAPASDDPARQKEYAVRARTQADRLQKLTSDLLELSRMEAQIGLQPSQSTDLSRRLREYSELYASWVEQSDLVLTTNLPDDVLMVPLGEKQLGHVVHNLLENAIKFTPKGGTITLGAGRSDDPGLPVKLWVEDTGIGIPVEDLPHLFERFHRGQNAAAYPGHGLGLAIVRIVVQSCGGDVRAQNTPSGARFTVCLPTVNR
ncbi:MAG: HAMP domain-containing histidine kinase [Chloroflexi bacterium]|nr:HAMP domain-containing histidine kinase [Chloroflexota bacterium]